MRRPIACLLAGCVISGVPAQRERKGERERERERVGNGNGKAD